MRNDSGSNPPDDNSRNPNRDFFGEKRSNVTHESATDLDAHIARKSDGDSSRLYDMRHVLMENRGYVCVCAHQSITGTGRDPHVAAKRKSSAGRHLPERSLALGWNLIG